MVLRRQGARRVCGASAAAGIAAGAETVGGLRVGRAVAGFRVGVEEGSGCRFQDGEVRIFRSENGQNLKVKGGKGGRSHVLSTSSPGGGSLMIVVSPPGRLVSQPFW